jgi:hypothetical protein
VGDPEDRKRLDDIVKTFVWCEKPFTKDDVAQQFRHETKHAPDAEQLERAMKRSTA